MRKLFSLLIIVLLCAGAHAQTRYVGGDISVLPLYEKHNSYYKDANGRKINELITWLVSDCGWNTFRVRIFVNPQGKAADGSIDPAVCQDLAYVTALGKRVKDAGAYFMLDFHYSDTWVDALHIQAPAAWKGKSDAAMADSVSAYTRRVLETLNAAGATPDLVQVGNEIMYGLCDRKVHPYSSSGDNWSGYLALLHAGCNAVREICPAAQIIIHTDRPNEVTNTKYYYNRLIQNGVDFDVIGLSYYPFWHGYLTAAQSNTNLVSSITSYAAAFPSKRIQIVECAYNFQYWAPSGISYDTRDIWPCSVAGQYNFVKDLVDALKPLSNVDGINYWFPEEAGNGDDTNWSTSSGTVLTTWLNRGFWNENQSNTGHAINRTATPSSTRPAAEVCAPYYMRTFYNEGQAVEPIEARDEAYIQKELRSGHLFIVRYGVRYSSVGQQLTE